MGYVTALCACVSIGTYLYAEPYNSHLIYILIDDSSHLASCITICRHSYVARY